MKTPREKHNDSETARLKKLAQAAGYKGMQGGWIYLVSKTTKNFYVDPGANDCVEAREVEDYRAVAQGWFDFEHRFAKAVGFVRVPFKG